jgi:hypothetical protein
MHVLFDEFFVLDVNESAFVWFITIKLDSQFLTSMTVLKTPIFPLNISAKS